MLFCSVTSLTSCAAPSRFDSTKSETPQTQLTMHGYFGRFVHTCVRYIVRHKPTTLASTSSRLTIDENCFFLACKQEKC